MTVAHNESWVKHRRRLWARLALAYLQRFPIQRGKGKLVQFLADRVEVRASFGARIRIKNILEYHQRILFEDDRSWEPEVQTVLRKLLKPGDVFFDVGANLGFFSLLASALVGPSGRVHSFEPVPTQYRHLVENVALNHADNIHTNQLALSDQDGSAEIFVSRSWNAGVHSLFPLADAVSTNVTTATLNRYCDEGGIKKIGLMKIDVEGAETLVLRGAATLLGGAARPVLVLEADDSHARRAGSSLEHLDKILRSAGYEVLELLEGGGVRSLGWPPAAPSNWLAFPTERRSSLPSDLSNSAKE